MANGKPKLNRRDAETAEANKGVKAQTPSPHPFPFSRVEKGRLEPPLSAWERGGGEDGH
jgi:hypothetical protein